MKPIFIAIAGGTGAGKSTVCYALWDKYPENILVVHLDDYFKQDGGAPVWNGMENWDHPDALHLDKLAEDLKALGRGESIRIFTKSQRLNPDYKTKGRIWVDVDPRPIVLVEGYLVLHDENIRNLFTTTIYLDVPHAIRYKRRVHFKIPEYEQGVLIPMHEQYVEPTKKYAEHVIDITSLSQEKVFSTVEKIVFSFFNPAGVPRP